MWCYTLFSIILNMSVTAGMVIVLVLLARLPLKKAPKVFSYVMWTVVLFRLICPVSFSTDFSLLGVFYSPTVTNSSITYIPTDIVHAANPQVDLPLSGISQAIHETLPQGDEQTVADPLEAPMAIATFLWLFGIAVMLAYSIVSVVILKKRLKSAQNTQGNIYEADNLKTPFVLGIFRPRIFIPEGLAAEEKSFIIRHEQTHIRRFDHIIKPVAFLVLSIHWFNPLVWISFILMGTDMELSCDERVIKEMGGEIKKAYSASLLSLTTGKRIINGSPLAFGEGNVGGRIKNVLNYKKPAFWVIAVAVIAVSVVSLGLLSNPRSDELTQSEAQKIVEGHYPSAISIISGTDQTIHNGVDFECYTFRVKPTDAETDETVAVDKTKGIFFTYNEKDGQWYAFTGAREKDPLTAQPTAFKTTETDLLEIGRIALDEYMATFMSDNTPDSDRIASYQINNISVLAGGIEEFCVTLNYDFTTDNDSYVNPGRGAKGKGTWPDNYLEIRIRNIGKYAYEIVSIGTGGGGQGLKPITDNTDIVYTEEEIEAARECVREYFSEVATSRVLNDLWFDEAACVKNIASYMQYGNGKTNGVSEGNVIVLLCNFTIENDNAFEGYYPDWQMILIRDSADGAWRIDDQGV